MANPMPEYHWKVTMRDDVQGFEKTFDVVAITAPWAIDAAHSAKIDAGYQPDQLNTVRLQRGKEASA